MIDHPLESQLWIAALTVAGHPWSFDVEDLAVLGASLARQYRAQARA